MTLFSASLATGGGVSAVAVAISSSLLVRPSGR
jgi:hypothetical protein